MNICVKEIDWMPKEFIPVKKFYKVFYDIDSDKIIGCGDFIVKESNDKSSIYVGFLEAYGNGSGRAIINYLLKNNTYVTLFGDAIPSSYGFWSKMGSKFGDFSSNVHPFVIEKGQT